MKVCLSSALSRSLSGTFSLQLLTGDLVQGHGVSLYISGNKFIIYLHSGAVVGIRFSFLLCINVGGGERGLIILAV